jgi:molybdopterin-guanine dinucleotide biosynthesis protein A
MHGSPDAVIGALIAGGVSSRYGAPKAFAEVGSERIVDRVLRALDAAVPTVLAIVNDPLIAESLRVPTRPDRVPDAGALGGIHAALHWARERGATAVLAVGCDTPLLPPALLAELADAYRRAAGADTAPDVYAAESGGRRGIEPLCAVYGVSCIAAIEGALERGDRRLIGFHGDVTVTRLPLARVAAHGDPATLFLNVNTPADRDTAERIIAGAARHA